ncbi:MAG: hypothetical protein IPL71_14710 [Anaerolineales bacterium]|uniref:hypothetical protein n=1 Tax=Candidatus Villigracilis proximus TaxID=3140683 RepID=UPI00313717A2|nr:hypothetical protein [Anaerolineales bacterium]
MNISTIIAIIVAVVILGGAVALVVVGMRFSQQGQQDEFDPVMSRLAEATQRGETVSLEEAELQQPFMERVVIPVIKKMGDISTRFTPQRLLQETTLKLELAGNPGRIDASTFLATRFVGAGLFGGLLLVVSIFSDNNWSVGRIFLTVIIFTALGFFFPNYGFKAKLTAAKMKCARRCQMRLIC